MSLPMHSYYIFDLWFEKDIKKIEKNTIRGVKKKTSLQGYKKKSVV